MTWQLGGHIEINLTTLAVLAAAVAADLLFRYLAFGDVESVAIDAAIFGAVSSGLELARQISSDGPEVSQWFERLGIGIVLTLVLSAAHRALKENLVDEIRDKLNEVARTQARDHPRGQASRVLRHIPEVAALSVQLTFTPGSPGLRFGKKRRRRRLAQCINSLSADPEVVFVTEDDFILPRRKERIFWLAVFGLAGAIGLLTPVVAFK